ncbi:Haloacid dehalogenase-like hydrolase domain-containing protein 3 [Smittium culicis]|uniref:Haloacid dehalogenase-like hydrolase domain-containing protein 3 n=1 Tax=Smittium culicis TaxID=133412 RepID=A0A1R1YPJ7_9FUNG|nr:Haloacid dehalogenase-like hydrolase domain-containing protein 3 [Smittium culicis]
MIGNAKKLVESAKFITFDAIDTLYRPRTSIGYSYLSFLEKNNLNTNNVTEQQMQKGFLKAFKDNDAKMPSYGLNQGITDYEWWRNVIKDSYTYSGVDANGNNCLAYNIFNIV